MHKIGQSGGFLGRLLGPLLKSRLPLMKNVLKPQTKSVLIPLGLIVAASATDAAVRKKMFGSGCVAKVSDCTRPLDLTKRATLITSNEEMNDIMKIVKSLEESGLLIKEVSETIKNEAKEQKGGFLGMLLGTSGVSLLGNLLTDKGTIRAGEGTIRAGKGTIRAGQDF